jgi:signal transduction histidine kinase
MSVRRQLVLGFGTLVIVLLVTGIVSVATFRATSASQVRVAHDLAMKITAIERLRMHAERLVATNRGFLLTQKPESLRLFEDHEQMFRRALGDVRESLKDDRVAEARLARVADAGAEYLTAAEQGMETRAARTKEGVAAYFDDVLQPARVELDQSLDELSATEWATYEKRLEQSKRNAVSSGVIVAATTLLGFGLSAGLALTFSRKLARQFEAEERALEAAQRASAAREELLSIVSHDLRNPLGAVLLGATILQGATVDRQLAQRTIESIGSAGERMKHLIETILTSSSLDTGTLAISRRAEPVRPLLEETLKLFERTAEKAGVGLSLELPENLSVDADSERLLQVLSNLVGNAIKFTPRSREVVFGAEPDRDCVRFYVQDAGPGIAEEQVPRLFERHWQAHRGQHSGLGLGLYIAKRIVELHGGRLWVETSVGAGSTFFFTIPSAAGRTVSAAPEPRVQDSSQPRLDSRGG